MAQLKERVIRQFSWGRCKSAGRNSSGRITIFHRGGGAKRLQRGIDLKRSTPSVGIVERIEYDPNRSSRIALVRWIDGVQLHRRRKCSPMEEFAPPRPFFEPTAATTRGLFSFSSLPGRVDQRKLACFSPGPSAACVEVGLPTKMLPFSALSYPNAKVETSSLPLGSSFPLPRIAVAGAKPAFFAPRTREEVIGRNTFSLCEVVKRTTDSVLWAHRIKHQAALSWQTLRQQETSGLVGAADKHGELKPKADQGSLHPRQVFTYALCNGRPSYQNASRSLFKALSPVEASSFGRLPAAKLIGEGPTEGGGCKVDRAPVTYVLASHQLETGKMVMNCDWPKQSPYPVWSIPSVKKKKKISFIL